MIMTLWSIFRASQALQGVIVLVIALLGFKGWQMHERKIGAEREAAKITKKADNDTLTANEVRADVAAGKSAGRVRSPYERKDDAGQ